MQNRNELLKTISQLTDEQAEEVLRIFLAENGIEN